MRVWRTRSALCSRRRRRSNLRRNAARIWPARGEATNLETASGRAYSRGPLVIAATVSTLGGLLFGYENIVISGAIGFLSQLFRLVASVSSGGLACAVL